MEVKSKGLITVGLYQLDNVTSSETGSHAVSFPVNLVRRQGFRSRSVITECKDTERLFYENTEVNNCIEIDQYS